MISIEQGDILKVGGLAYPVIVVSNGFFNTSGKAVVCPILKEAMPGPLHIRISEGLVEGYVLCEQVRYVDLAARRFSKLNESGYSDIFNISDAVMSIFDNQIF